jgi:serine protease Do
MNKRCLGRRARIWVAGFALLAIAGTLAFAAGTMSKDVGTSPHSDAMAWYADTGSARHEVGSAVKPTDTRYGGAGYAANLSKVFRNASERVLQSVVMITNTPTVAVTTPKNGPSPGLPDEFQNGPFGDLVRAPEVRRFFKNMPSLPGPGVPWHGVTGVGSGVIVDPSGVILTNAHVVRGDGEITVRLQDGREFDATHVKTDPKTDLAILKIEGADGLVAARLGDSDQMEVGDWVLALGQPFGLEGTVTAGIISAKGRGIGIADRENFLQTDAAINPGNSGGPLVNLYGEVVGINTAISSRTGAYQGVGFAIPINLAKWVGQQLTENGTVRRAFLGVVIQPVTQALADQFGVKVREGVLVAEVRSDTPAAKAGLKPGDVIVRFSGQAVANPRELQNLVERAEIGSPQTVIVVRDGKRITLNVTVREQPEDFDLAAEGAHHGGSSTFDKLGLDVATLTPEVAEQLGVEGVKGVVIADVKPGSLADMAGLSTSMVITQVDRKPVDSVAAFRKIIADRPLKEGLLLLIRTAEGSRFVVLKASE